jgi:hypothetical protein
MDDGSAVSAATRSATASARTDGFVDFIPQIITRNTEGRN